MKIVFYTSGLTGSGRLVHGLTIANAFQRSGLDFQFTVLHSSSFGHLVQKMGFTEIYVEPESKEALSATNYKYSQVYNHLASINPDILIVDLQWFTLFHFIDELDCIKVFLARQVINKFYTIPLEKGVLEFDASPYDYCFKTEPFESAYNFNELNPFVLRNRSEILSRSDALIKLNLDPTKKHCLYAFNGHPEDFEKHKQKYQFLKDEFEITYTTNYKQGIFPIVDYFNAFNIIVCGAGYNQFWEVKYFNKNAYIEPVEGRFELSSKRLQLNKTYFSENGADQLVEALSKHQ